MVEREVTSTQQVRFARCDGPACDKTVEQGPVPTVVDLPPGWLFLITVAPPGEALVPHKHYCSRDCLADAVVP